MDFQFSKMKDDYLLWCKLVSEKKDRQVDIANRYDISQPRVAEMISVGRKYSEFIPIRDNLPKSKRAIYMISTMDNNDREMCLDKFPNATQEQIKQFKKPRKEKKKDNIEQEKKKEKQIERERERLRQEKEDRWEKKVAEQEKIVEWNQALKIFGISIVLKEIKLTEESLTILYKGLLHKNHPDKGGNNEDFIKIKQAYKVLKK